MDKTKLPLTRILVFIAISTVLLLIATQTISANSGFRGQIDQSKQQILSSANKLCGFKVGELQQKVGDGEHTNADLVMLSRLRNEDGSVNNTECVKLSTKILEEGLQ